MHERISRGETEISSELVQAYADTFIPRYDLYPLQLRDGLYVSVKKPLELAQIRQHLKGTLTLGAYTLSPTDMASWLCLDADDEQGWHSLVEMAGMLLVPSIPMYLEQSRRGGHLWLFFESSIPGKQARHFGRYLLAQHEIEGVELFPKQDGLTTGPGSLVRLPLGIHRKTGIRYRYHFINPDGSPLAPTLHEQVRLLAYPNRVPPGIIESCLAQARSHPHSPPVTLSPTSQGTGETLSARLKDRITVYDFVSQYVQLDERGRGLCPFHDDHHASFCH